jgi:hypothetical protein
MEAILERSVSDEDPVRHHLEKGREERYFKTGR